LLQELVAYLVPSDKFSFPSGHTDAAFVMTTVVTYYYQPFSVRASTVATLIGSSRVLLGVHSPHGYSCGDGAGFQ
jgi:undecaprenyl-diphosphatase